MEFGADIPATGFDNIAVAGVAEIGTLAGFGSLVPATGSDNIAVADAAETGVLVGFDTVVPGTEVESVVAVGITETVSVGRIVGGNVAVDSSVSGRVSTALVEGTSTGPHWRIVLNGA